MYIYCIYVFYFIFLFVKLFSCGLRGFHVVEYVGGTASSLDISYNVKVQPQPLSRGRREETVSQLNVCRRTDLQSQKCQRISDFS